MAGLIESMRTARELNPLALFTEPKKSSDDRPQDALKFPAPKGRNLTLTENAASPFHAEPRQFGSPINHPATGGISRSKPDVRKPLQKLGGGIRINVGFSGFHSSC